MSGGTSSNRREQTIEILEQVGNGFVDDVRLECEKSRAMSSAKSGGMSGAIFGGISAFEHPEGSSEK